AGFGYGKDEQYSCSGENDRCRDNRVLQSPGYQTIQKHQHNKSSDNDHDAPIIIAGKGPPHALWVYAFPKGMRKVCSRVLVTGDDAGATSVTTCDLPSLRGPRTASRQSALRPDTYSRRPPVQSATGRCRAVYREPCRSSGATGCRPPAPPGATRSRAAPSR